MDILKEHGLKETKTRQEILTLLENESPLCVDQIFERLKESKIKISSIYRNLSTFVEEGILIKTIGLDNVSYYQLNKEHHVHQLVCTNCGKIVVIDHGSLIDIEKEIEKKTGYKITSHSFEFSGLCPECQMKLA